MGFETMQNGSEAKESINTGLLTNDFENESNDAGEEYEQVIKDKIKAMQNRHEDITKQSMAFRDSAGPAGVDSPLLKALELEIESLKKELKNSKSEKESNDFESQKDKLLKVIDKMGGVYSETLDKDYDTDEIEGIIVGVIMGEQDISTIPRAVVYGSEKNLREHVKELIATRDTEQKINESENNESESNDFETQKNKLFAAIDKMGGVYSETLDKDYDADEIEGAIVAVIMGEQDISTIPRTIVYGSEKNLREQVKELIEVRKSELN